MRLFTAALGFLVLLATGRSVAGEPPPLEPLLNEELRRLEGALGERMGLVLFRTDDPTVQAFISSGILHVPQEAYLRLESGLAAVAVLEGKHNNEKRPMCYVLYNPPRAGSSERAFYRPIWEATGDARQGAAFLAAHETAHCLDHLEREDRLASQMRWGPEEASRVGLQPDAFSRVFGGDASTAAYRSRLTDLYGDLAQRQYEERVADAFGVLWVWRMGGSEAVLSKVLEVRQRDLPTNAHATAPTLRALPVLKLDLETAASIDAVWALARRVQHEVGVDPALGPGSRVAQDPLADALLQARRARPRSTPTPQPVSKPWSKLPRFGEPAR